MAVPPFGCYAALSVCHAQLIRPPLASLAADQSAGDYDIGTNMELSIEENIENCIFSKKLSNIRAVIFTYMAFFA